MSQRGGESSTAAMFVRPPMVAARRISLRAKNPLMPPMKVPRMGSKLVSDSRPRYR